MPAELKKIIEKIGLPKPESASHEESPVYSEKEAGMPSGLAEKERPKGEFLPPAANPSNIIAITNAQQHIKEEVKMIEKVLEKDLAELYLNMSPEKQREFRVKGEETAKQINVLLHQAKIQIKKIIDLIKKWLAIIPGVNKFFLEQEAKIKADELIKNKWTTV